MTTSQPAISPELLAAALDASDAEERRQATSLIGELFLHDALPLLLRALGDSDWRVRKEATHVSRAFVPAPLLISAMIGVFQSGDDVGLRNAAVEVLASCGNGATAPLAAALGRLDADGRKLVVQALGATRDPHALSVLARALDDSDSNVRQGAVEAISRLGPLAPAEVQRLLLLCLGGDDPFAQHAALEGLNALGAVVPWPRLEPLIAHPTLRAVALASAALAQDPEAPAAITRTLRSARGAAFTQAMAALARLAEGPLLPHVAAALASEGPQLGERLVQVATATTDPQHQRATALFLAATAGAPGVVDAAAFALEDEAFYESADRALRVLGPKAWPELATRIAPLPQTHRFSPEVRAALIEAATVITHAPSVTESSTALLLDALRSAAKEEDRHLTTSALCALSRLGTAQDLEFVLHFAGSSSKPIAFASEAALSVLTSRHPEAARQLADAFVARAGVGNTDETFAAVVVLGALAAVPGASGQPSRPADIVFLTRAATLEDTRIRRAAIEAMGKLDGSSAFDALSLALTDETREVQLAAARALGRLGQSACFHDSEGLTISLRAVMDVVSRSMDPELVATTIRCVGEDLTITAGDEASAIATKTLIDVFAPLALQSDAVVAIAAVESLGRLPLGTTGRQSSLAAALAHPDDAVVKAAMLKLDTSGAEGGEIVQCLDHPSHDVRLLAAEVLAGSDNPALREHVAERTSIELDLNVRDTFEGALSTVRWRGERTMGGS